MLDKDLDQATRLALEDEATLRRIGHELDVSFINRVRRK